MIGILLPLTAALQLSAVAASPQDNPDQYLDPDIVKEMSAAKEANLTNAMAKSRIEAEASARRLAILMISAEAAIRSALEDLGGSLGKNRSLEPGSLEESADDLHLAAQMLAQKTTAFRSRAAAAGLRIPEADPGKDIPKRSAYPSKDRKKDLKSVLAMLKKAEGKTGAVRPSEEQAALGAAVQGYAGELRSCGMVLGKILKALKEKRQSRPELSVAEKRIEAHVERWERDAEDVDLEGKNLEAALQLSRHDEESFEQGY